MLNPKVALALTVAAVAGQQAIAQQASQPLLGFTEAGAAAQHRLEAAYDSHLDPDDLAAWMHELAREPHHLGSSHDARNVETLRGWFTEWGYDTEVARYDVLLPTPVTRTLTMTAPHVFTASLTERAVDGDASSASSDVLPPYNAFSPDDDVTGELVYVNYGTREDYELLARYGVDVEGKIVIVRYGRVFRGVKPRLAAEHGAIGCLIFSDPADDGYYRGEVYPEGPYKNDSAVQRGSIMDLPLHAGDLLTPGWAAVEGAERLARDEAPAMPTIPTLPISYGDARPLLDAIEGPVAPTEWRGALPITYRIGPGPATVRLTVKFDWRMVTAMNVVARLKGARWPDQWVLRGNHHDAWNHGARDPIAGLVTVLAEAKAIAQLPERPGRTVLFAAWGAEEQGLMGSTEWAEENREELTEKAVLYTNTDGNGRGFVRLGGSHALTKFWAEVQRDVADPQTGLSLADRNRARIRATGDEKARKDLAERDLALGALGSGSDYSAFFHHLGISSANISADGEAESGSYHTLYDTVEHYERFVDPGHVYGVVLAKTTGRATLRMANAPLLPFDFKDLASTIKGYVKEVEELADKQRAETARVNGLIESGEFAAALDPTKALQPPPLREDVPHFNFAPIHNALAKLDTALNKTTLSPDLDAATLDEINTLLYTAERLLLREEGLPGRPWFRHQIYSPGRYTGYGAKTLPWVREAIEQRQYDQVEPGVTALAAALNALAAQMERVKALAG
ncbi:MAG: M28 family peptidase [Gammaproteobacteria bacterium]|nr:M28 family peptidase [Gammaproteobacteria bacterium]